MPITSLNFSPPKNTSESPCKIATKPSAEVEDLCEDQTYEVVEMQVTSSAKTRYAPAQTPQGDTATLPVESEVKIEDAAAQEENQETYMNCD